MGEGAHTSLELSHHPTPPSLDIYTGLACKPVGCHVSLFSQSSSSCSIYPSDYSLLCSPIANSTLFIHEHQVVDRVGFEKPNFTVIYDVYVWVSEE